MKTKASAFLLGLALLTGARTISAAEQPDTSADRLAKEFANPPPEARPWVYWWWLNGAASKEGITRDFEEMRKQGIGGALLFDAGEAGPDAPRGPKFMSDEWRELFKHALREADRCGVVLTANLCSGWNAGGPWVTGGARGEETGCGADVRQRPGTRQSGVAATSGRAGVLPRHRGVGDAHAKHS